MAWIKAELVSGHHVTIGVIDQPHGPNDLPYSHIANVVRVDSVNSSAPYLGRDVMYIDDHGLFTCSDTQFPCSAADNPAVPPGAGGDGGCTPLMFGYTFDAWQGPFKTSQSYLIPRPTAQYKNHGYSVYGIAGEIGTQRKPLSYGLHWLLLLPVLFTHRARYADDLFSLQPFQTPTMLPSQSPCP